MFSVRIDKDGAGYVFRTSPCPGSLEMVALDSAPGVIAIVEANDPASACARAWYLAMHMHDGDEEQIAGQGLLQRLLGEK